MTCKCGTSGKLLWFCAHLRLAYHAGVHMYAAYSSCLGPVKIADGKISPKKRTSVTEIAMACCTTDQLHN